LSRAVGTSVLPSNQWIHVACTLSTTETSVWVDGRLEASLAHPTDLETAPTVTIGEGTIGAWTQSNQMLDRELVGMIDDVYIYDCVLTPEGIAWLAGRTESFDASL
jgi:hypothetical protein